MLARWMIELTMVSMSSCWIEAIKPKSRITSRFLLGSFGSAIFIRLPGCGSEWKNPTCRSCTRKLSCPTPMRSRISSLGQSESFTPSIHSVTSTRRVHKSSYTFGTYTPCTFSWFMIKSLLRRWFSASFKKSSSV